MMTAYIRSFANILAYLLIKDKTKINADIKRYMESYEITPPRKRYLCQRTCLLFKTQ